MSSSGHSESREQEPTQNSGIHGHSEKEKVSYTNLVHLLWETRVWRLYSVLLVQITGMLLLLPVLPTLVTDDFASKRAHMSISCEAYEPKEAPEACQNAHSDVVYFSTVSGLFQNAVFSVLLTPLLGWWSDIHGRKPVLLLSQSLAVLPVLVVILHFQGIISLSWIYVVQACTGSVSAIAPSLSYIADMVPPMHRAASFGLIMATFSVSILIGPFFGAMMKPEIVPWATLLSIGCAVCCTLLFVPESLTAEASERARNETLQGREASVLLTPKDAVAAAWRGFSILKRSNLFIRLTIILMLGSIVSEGLQDILIQYLQIKIGFKAVDVSHMFMILGAGALVVQGFLLQILLRYFGETRLLALGLCASTLQQFSLTLATKKWQALTAVSLGSLGSVTFPTISSIKANNAQEHEQGSVQGALYGARAVASGVGPLAFAFLFSLFSRSDSPLPFFPGAPFILGTIMMIFSTILALSLEPGAGGNSGMLFDRKHTTERAMYSNDDEEGATLLSTPSVTAINTKS